jgi:hypothetical protein
MLQKMGMRIESPKMVVKRSSQVSEVDQSPISDSGKIADDGL